VWINPLNRNRQNYDFRREDTDNPGESHHLDLRDHHNYGRGLKRFNNLFVILKFEEELDQKNLSVTIIDPYLLQPGNYTEQDVIGVTVNY
jgi:hypothetical protein